MECPDIAIDTRGAKASASSRGTTDRSAARSGTTLFLLAHQDDELMLSPLIADAKREGRSVAVIFLTNGDGGSASSGTRNRETFRLLSKLGVNVAEEVEFLGDQLGITDGKLYTSMMDAHTAVLGHLARFSPVDAIYVHAWEGGNPDHDAAYALALGVGRTLEVEGKVYQTPFYRAPRRGPLPFLLYAPLEANGPVGFYRLGLMTRLNRLTLVRFYPSQKLVFFRFWPFMLIDALLRPGVPIQQASSSRLGERPMPEALRYERIGYVNFETMAPHITGYWRSVMDATEQQRRGGATGVEYRHSTRGETWMPE